jgi:hypothetical protein
MRVAYRVSDGLIFRLGEKLSVAAGGSRIMAGKKVLLDAGGPFAIGELRAPLVTPADRPGPPPAEGQTATAAPSAFADERDGMYFRSGLAIHAAALAAYDAWTRRPV